ncbi:MAG: ABC-F family ATP-binding cassette domain-containing protein [Acutalibacteraceae bacterium]
MAVLSVQGLSVAFVERVLFENVGFEVEQRDKIGFIGANGAGKTTIFKILAGTLQPTNGAVIKSKDVKIGYMQQHACTNPDRSVYDELLSVFSHLQEAEKEIEAITNALEKGKDNADSLIERQLYLQEKYENEGGLTYKSRTRSALLGLGFTDEDMNTQTKKLSGGQLSKLSLAKLLLGGANLLLLDEPTNHLDISSVEWLEGFIRDFKGAVIVISHDRYFLDAVTNKTMELEHKKITCYTGGYTEFINKKEKLNEDLKRKYENDLKEIKRIEGIVEQQKRWGQKHNFITAASKQKQADRLKEQLVVPDGELDTLSFKLTPKAESGNDVLICTGLEKSFGEKTLFKNVDLHITKGERVFLLGPNGCGKTTLLKILKGIYETSGEIKLGANVDIGYFDQVQADLNPDKTALDEVWDSYPDMTQTQVRTALGSFMFSGDEVFKPVKNLSGGERARIALLKLMLKGANLLLLDEPTNHLDASSREALEKTLGEYGGTMFIISHDRYFINKLADRIITLSENGAASFLGNYDRYIEKQKGKEAQAKTEQKKEKQGNNDYFAKKQLQSEIRKTRTRLSKCEQEIENTEQRISELEQLLQSEETATDFERLTELSAELENMHTQNERLMEEWTEIQEQLETLEKGGSM